MARLCIILAALVLGVLAVDPSSDTIIAHQSLRCNDPVNLDVRSNVWKTYTLAPNSIYRAFATRAAEKITDPADKAKALKIANTGTFVWIESPSDSPKIDEIAADVPCSSIVGIVLAGLPRKTCSSGSPQYDYLRDFLTPVVSRISAYPHTAFAVIVEPNVLYNFILRTEPACQELRETWYTNVPTALRDLDLPNVITYLDGGHGGLFGWTGRAWQGSTSIVPNWYHGEEGSPIHAAKEFDKTWKAGGGMELKQFRGLAVNVRGYNSWDTSPGENFGGENTCYDLYNRARNEKRYLEYLRVAGLQTINSSMPFHNIMDTARNGVQGIREGWDDWCNVNGAGAGRKPSADTGDANLDAFVWASAIGVSDGASELGGAGYVADCAKINSFKPMPGREQFSQEYFELGSKGCKDCVKRRVMNMGMVGKRCG